MSLAEQPRREDGSEFEIRMSSEHDGYLIQPRGELDLATSPPLHAALTKALQSNHDRVVLDLSALEFIDSTGIHTIILAVHTASEQGKQLALLRGPRQIQRVFELAGISDHLPFVD